MSASKTLKITLVCTTALMTAALAAYPAQAATQLIDATAAGPITVGAGNDLVVTGSGTISGATVGAQLQVSAGSITNNGHITGSLRGIVMETGSLSNGLSNSGVINGAGADGLLIGFTSTIAGGIDNVGTGVIEGAQSGITFSRDSTADTLTNAGLVSGGSHGLVFATGGAVLGAVGNSGTVKGGLSGILVTGAGSGIAGVLTNSGTISGGNEGIFLKNGGQIGGIHNSGTIKGGSTGIIIENTASNISGGIVNSGTITGHQGIVVQSGAALSGGITNDTGGVIKSTSSFAIILASLTSAVPITLNGGQIIGDVTDTAPANGFSPVTVGGAFATDGDFSVSDLILPSAGTLTISAGNTFITHAMTGGPGTLIFGVASAASTGKLVVTGAPDLTGTTLKVDVTHGAALADGDLLPVIQGGAPIVGAPAFLTPVEDNSFLWNFAIGNSGNPDDLSLFVTANPQGSCLAAATAVNQSVCNTLEADAGTTNAQLQQILSNLNGAATAQRFNDILSASGPTVDGSDVTGAFDIADSTLALDDTRLAGLRDGTAGMAAGNAADGLGAWGQAFGQYVDQGDRGGIAGYRATTGGGALGIDTARLLDRATLGLGFSYGRADAHSRNANTTDTDVNSYQISLYGLWDLTHGGYISGTAAYGWDNIDRTRHDAGGIAGLDAHGSYNAQQIDARIEGGRDIAYRGMILTPNVAAHWANWDPDSYNETGAGGADLHIAGNTLNLFEAGPGVKAAWSFKNADGSVLQPQLSANYNYAFTSDRIADTSSFDGGGGAFITEGPTPARSAADFGAQFRYKTVGNWDLTAHYDFDWRDNYTAHTGFLQAAYKF